MSSFFAGLAFRLGHTRARSLIVACGLLLGLALGMNGAWVVVDLRSNHVHHAEQTMTNLAFVLAAELDRELQGIDLLSLSLIEHLRDLGIDSADAFDQQVRPLEVHQDLARRIAGLPHIAALSLHDRHGALVNFSRSWPAPDIDVRDRDFIRLLLAEHAPQTVISAPVQSKSTGKWTIYFSRRFEAPDGQLIGIVVCSIVGDYFEQLFSRLAMDEYDAFGIYRSGGILLIRYPHVDAGIGATFGQSDNYRRMLGALDHGAVRFTSALDGADRIVAARSVAHYPLIVTVSDTIGSILEDWSAEAKAFGVATGLLELVIVLTVVLAVRHLRSYERLQAAQAAQARAEERERGVLALQAQEHRFDSALSNMVQGLLMFDHDGRMLVANRRFCQMFGLPADALAPGMTYRAVTERIVEAGEVTAEDMRYVRGRRADLLARGERATATWELGNGRAFTMTHQPTEDGWLSTFEEISERRAAEARMLHIAQHDALTDLPNRALLRKELEDALAGAGRGEHVALLCLDLDQFKAVNDTLGHPVGDALLQAVAERLVNHARRTDTVGRLGGDEFAIVHGPFRKPAEAVALANRLIEMFATPFEVAGHQIVIGTSIGLALAPQDGADGDELMKNADLALYRAKTDGRGVCRLFQAEMDAAMQARRLLEIDLRDALRAGQFELFYQPVVDLRRGAVTGFEALLRWRHPVRGLVSPTTFIPLAEELGLIVPIGEWVLREACARAATWPDHIRVAVNLSAVQFTSRDLVAVVASALRDAGLPPERLELEITESVMLQDTEATLAMLHQFRALGAGIAMDDFGTGYSSLSYLRRFPFDRIKIDQCFVRELDSRPDCGAIVRAVAALSRELGMATTAEGVETREHLDVLARAGCTDVQGYLFSAPVPADEVLALLPTIAAMMQRSPTEAALTLVE